MDYLLVNRALDYSLQCRQNMLNLIKGLSFDELNKVPNGFNNNILWNAAHCIVTQQLLCYNLAGLEMAVDKEKIASFRKGTKVEGKYDLSTLDFIIENAEELIEQMRADYDKLDFSAYQEYSTSFGTTLTSINDAIIFNGTHEGLHFGYMMALKRTILAKN